MWGELGTANSADCAGKLTRVQQVLKETYYAKHPNMHQLNSTSTCSRLNSTKLSIKLNYWSNRLTETYEHRSNSTKHYWSDYAINEGWTDAKNSILPNI